MTRTRNGSFSDTTDYDADVDAPMFARVMKEIAQNLHMIYDAVTGQNSPGSAPVVQVIDHSGAAGGGSLLGMPSWQQSLNKRVFVLESELGTYAINNGYVAILAKPHWIVAGEDTLVIDIDTDSVAGSGELFCEVYDTSGVLTHYQSFSPVDADGPSPTTWRTTLTFSSTSVTVYIIIKKRFQAGQSSIFLYGWRGYVNRIGAPAPPMDINRAGTNNYPVSSINVELLHDGMFTADYALAAHLPNTLNRLINMMWEYCTGAPVVGNTSLTLTVLKEHRRFNFSTEPLLEWPLFGEALGAFGWGIDNLIGESWSVVNTTDGPTAGFTTWYAPYSKVTTEATIHRNTVALDFYDVGSATYPIKCNILAISEMNSGSFKYSPGLWEARIYNTATGTASSWVAFAQIGSTTLVKALITDVPYNGTIGLLDWEGLELRVRKTSGAYQFGELAILGWNLYYDP